MAELIRQKKESVNPKKIYLKMQSEENKEQKNVKSEKSLQDSWDSIKGANIFLTRVKEGKEVKKKKLV